MADIRSEILGKYKIDIAQENIFKLYKIDGADISPQDLEMKIQETRKRWEASTNGANEKNAERDRLRLSKADQYESILRNVKLREKVYIYYAKPAGSGASGEGRPADSIEFAREYFQLLATSKKIRKADVDFFFNYYQAERKKRKDIEEMLKKDFKVAGLGKESVYEDEKEEPFEGKKKDDSSPVIVNLFKSTTVLRIRDAFDLYKKAEEKGELCRRYPKLNESLYEFLELKEINNAEAFADLMAKRGKDAYNLRQDQGEIFIPLVDLFNKLKDIGGYQDVMDNFSEFKLLLKYPNLTPYMFSFVKMKKNTLKGIMNIANRDYVFRDETDFILNYYQPVHDNFGISNEGIDSIIHKAEKKAKQNKVLNEIDEKLGRRKKRKISVGAEIIHWLVYWPIFAVYFVFEVAKTVFTKLSKLVIPISAAVFILSNWLFPKIFGIENLLVLRKIVFKAQWLSFLYDFAGEFNDGWYNLILWSVAGIIYLLAIYLLPAFFAFVFVAEFADGFNKRYDWVGIERTFRNILQDLRKKTEDQYLAGKELFIKKKIPKIVINILCLASVFAMLYFLPMGISKASEITGYGQEVEKEETFVHEAVETEDYETEGYKEETIEIDGDIMIITADTANIRSGPGTDYDVVATAEMGDIFISTGMQETASNGRIWYEIYLNDEFTETGWASEKVMELL